MKIISKFSTFILIFLVAGTATGQESLSLDQSLRIARSQNLSLKRAALGEMLDKPNTQEAWGRFLPHFDFSFRFQQDKVTYETWPQDDGTVIKLANDSTKTNRDSNWNLAIEQWLFVGGRNYRNLKNNKLSIRVRELNYRNDLFLVRSSVTTAYCQAVGARKYLDLAKTVVHQRTLQREMAQIRFETGSVTKRDVLKADVDLGVARNDSLSAASAARRLVEILNLLVGFPLDTTYVLGDLPPIFEPIWDIDSLADLAISTRPDLNAADLNTKITRNDYLSAVGDHLPQLLFFMRYDKSQPSGPTQNFTVNPLNRNIHVELFGNWMLFDRYTKKLNRQRAKLNHKQAVISLEEMELEVRRQVRDEAESLLSLYYQNLVAHTNSKLAEETLKFEQERYRLGGATVIELGMAQILYIEALQSQINLESQFHIALGELEQAIGITLRTAG